MASKPLHGRVSAAAEDDFVLFLIGMRVNRYRDLRAWWTSLRAMTRMLKELRAHPELGLLHAEGAFFFGGPAVIEYWKSYEHLEAYARSADAQHLPAWRAYNKLARSTDSVGIYHETYRVTAGNFEVMYNHMPSVGLLAATGPVRLARGSTSAQRIGARDDDTAPVEAPN